MKACNRGGWMQEREKLLALREEIRRGGGKAAAEKQHNRGKGLARERINRLFDPGTFEEIDGFVMHRCVDFGMEKRKWLGDGLVGGYGKVHGRLVFAYAQDFTVQGGSMGEEQANRICRLIEMAMENGAPLVGLNDSSGARIQEGVSALDGYGKIFRMHTRASGIIPQIAAVLGPCAGGAAYSPALMDFVFTVEGISRMFITGPDVIRAVTGESMDSEELGGAATHSAISGNAHFMEPTEEACLARIRELLGYLPSSWKNPVPREGIMEEMPLLRPALEQMLPVQENRAYDMTTIVREISDNGTFLEYMAHYARNILTGMVRLAGKPVGIVANQPCVKAGCLDIDAADKAARFVRTCDAFGLPLITLVDAPGFLPGKNQELNGVIRHGAKLLYAYSEATVPKLTVILRKAFGGAYLAMCSKALGSDMVYAWPTAQIAVMGEEGAANILLRGTDNPEEKAQWKKEYRAAFLTPYRAAARGQVDDVILPGETRKKLLAALDMLQAKKRAIVEKRHGNIPL